MEDEEIILGNSPLDEYLQQVTDIPFSKYNSDTVLNQNTTDSTFQDEHHSSNAFEKTFTKVLSFCRSDAKVAIELLESVLLLCESNLLQEDDHVMLVDIKDDVTRKKQALHLENKGNIFQCLSIGNNYIKFAMLVLLFGIGMKFRVLFTILILSIVVLLYLLFVYKNQTDNQVLLQKCVTKFVEQFSHFDQLIDKSIKHLKEVEVINHGIHVFYNKIPGTSVVINNTKKCLRLRHFLMDTLINMFTETQRRTKCLIECHTNQLFFYKEEFVASLPLDNFDNILPKNNNSKLKLSDIPLNKLKTIAYLHRIVLSEFVLSSVICIHCVLNGKLGSHVIDKLVSSFSCILKIHDTYYQDMEETLSKSIDDIFKKRDVIQEKTSMKIESKDSLFNSCKLNIYSSLSRMEEMQALLLDRDRSSVNIATFENLLLQFNLNLDNAKACLEDIYNVYRPDKIPQACENQNSDVEDEAVNDEHPTLFVPRKQDGDLLFEGESRGETSKRTTYEDLEELEKAAKESKESRRLLRELKTVFAVKESPIGLLKFPLQKVLVDNLNSEIFDQNEEQVDLQLSSKQHITDETFSGNNEYKNDEFDGNNDESVTRVSLPAGFLNQLRQSFPSQNEETFGSTSEDEND